MFTTLNYVISTIQCKCLFEIIKKLIISTMYCKCLFEILPSVKKFKKIFTTSYQLRYLLLFAPFIEIFYFYFFVILIIIKIYKN